MDCRTYITMLDEHELAKMIKQLNDHALNSYIQQIRRRLSILERSLVTARSKAGKSYIYANFNPKYAQYALTLLRTYYNFCLPIKGANKWKLTTAQLIGLTDKAFNWKDIIHFK